MKLNPFSKASKKTFNQTKRRLRIRKKIFGTSEKPRLRVFKSAKNIYAQLIDDDQGKVLCSASSLKLKKTLTKEVSKTVGEKLGEQAKAKKLTKVVFDRGGYNYHGRIQALADGARAKGLEF